MNIEIQKNVFKYLICPLPLVLFIFFSETFDNMSIVFGQTSDMQIAPPLKAVFKGHQRRVISVAFSPDGKKLASGSGDDTVRLWDVPSGKQLAVLERHSSSVDAVAFSPDGKILASGGWDAATHLWNVSDGEHLARLMGKKYTDFLRGRKNYVWGLAFSPDGEVLAAAMDNNTIRLWDIAARKSLGDLNGHENSVTSVAYSPTGKILASSAVDGSVRLWDISSRKQLALSQHKEWIGCITFSPDGEKVAYADQSSDEPTVYTWDVTKKEPAQVFSRFLEPDGDEKVFSIAFSPDGNYLVFGHWNHTITIWNAETKKRLATFTAHGGAVNSVAFSPDGKTLASAGGSIYTPERDRELSMDEKDYTIRLWDMSQFEKEVIGASPANE